MSPSYRLSVTPHGGRDVLHHESNHFHTNVKTKGGRQGRSMLRPYSARPRVAAIGVHFAPTSVHFAPIGLHVAPDDRCFGPASPCVERVNRRFAANTGHPGAIEAG